MEGFYTIEDIAKIIRVTTRTIRNYLKDGTLKGRKIGGGWRFTDADLEAFFKHGFVAEAFQDATRQDVMNFFNGEYTNISGKTQICSIIDIYKPMKAIMQLRDNIMQLVRGEGNSFVYSYDKAKGRARFVLIGTAEYLTQAINLIHADETATEEQ